MSNRMMENETKANKDAPEREAVVGRYAAVNGLNMYYEIHGESKAGDSTPLVLMHGAFSGIGTSFGLLLPSLAKNRQIIAVELQGHARTADIDRPLTIDLLAEDVVALLQQIGVKKADFFGYSMGSAVAMQIAIQHPDLVRKLVLASISYKADGLHPGMLEGMESMKPENLYGSPFHDEYMRLAPKPENFPILMEKIIQLDRDLRDWTPEEVQSIKAPVLLVIGDSDIIRPEHTVEMFRLFGGGVIGDIAGLPRSQLAVLPGTTHITVVYRAEWLNSMIGQFLDAPDPEGS